MVTVTDQRRRRTSSIAGPIDTTHDSYAALRPITRQEEHFGGSS
jgi:hypothetical protein